MVNKWIVYQKERFPLLTYSAMALVFSFSGLCLSHIMRGQATLPEFKQASVAFLTALLLFMQLRIADEFKDYDADCLYQADRPVPRGLITLRELGVLGILSGLLQLFLTVALSIKLVPILLALWLYLTLMSAEFFIGEHLRESPLAYLLTHMPILLLLDTYITACDWLLAGIGMPPHLVLFLFVSFLNGMLIELGRKLRAPKDEKLGVETYTSAWGLKRAVGAWLVTMSSAGLIAILTARLTDAPWPACLLLPVLLGVSALTAIRFNLKPTKQRAQRLETLSSLWVMSTYLSLGTLPALARSLFLCMH